MLAGCIVGCASAFAEPLVNADFEAPAIYPAACTALAPGQSDLPGWTIGGPVGAITVEDGIESGMIPFSGTQWIKFHARRSGNGGTLAQSFSTIVGEVNVLSFALSKDAASNGGKPVSLTVQVFASDGTLLANKRCCPQNQEAWTVFQLPFVPTTSSATVVLADTSSLMAGADLCLDRVAIGQGKKVPHKPKPVIGPFTNGDFELPLVPAYSSQPVNVGDTWLTGWSVGGPGGDIVVNNLPGARSGTQWITFNGGDTLPGGTLSQTFATAIGKTNTVSFSIFQNGPSSPGAMNLCATVFASDGSVLASNTFSAAEGFWHDCYLQFKPKSSVSTIKFEDTSSETIAVDLCLDRVTVTQTNAVPAPVVGPFTNGDFELPSIPESASYQLNAGDTWLMGWSVGGPGGDIVLNNLPEAYSGNQWIVFNGGDTQPGGTLSQTFATVVGRTNKLSFFLSQTGPSSPNAVSLTATVLAADGSTLTNNTFFPTQDIWQQFELQFTPTTSRTTIKLEDSSTETVAVDLWLDRVDVSCPNAQ